MRSNSDRVTRFRNGQQCGQPSILRQILDEFRRTLHPRPASRRECIGNKKNFLQLFRVYLRREKESPLSSFEKKRASHTEDLSIPEKSWFEL
jgi:hypothetical protein